MNGVYIAGGIAASNRDLFGENFMAEFTTHRSEKFTGLLKEIPITMITNYDISLKGAAFALKIADLA